MPYKDPEKNKECKSKWAKTDASKKKAKEYYENNKERILAKDKQAKKEKFDKLSTEEQENYLIKRRTQCLNSYYKHRDKILEKNKKDAFKKGLKYLYNISYEEYLELLNKQNNICGICGCGEFENRWTSKNLPFAVDHCHTSNIIRGLLCDNCNVGLGHFKDNIEIMKKAIEYLENDRGRNN